jgi:hypothetical protein
MKFETVEIEDLAKAKGVVPATLHYHEDQQVHLRIIEDEGNASAEERIKELEKAIWQISLGPEDSDSEWIPYVMQKCNDILTKKQ